MYARSTARTAVTEWQFVFPVLPCLPIHIYVYVRTHMYKHARLYIYYCIWSLPCLPIHMYVYLQIHIYKHACLDIHSCLRSCRCHVISISFSRVSLCPPEWMFPLSCMHFVYEVYINNAYIHLFTVVDPPDPMNDVKI